MEEQVIQYGLAFAGFTIGAKYTIELVKMLIPVIKGSNGSNGSNGISKDAQAIIKSVSSLETAVKESHDEMLEYMMREADKSIERDNALNLKVDRANEGLAAIRAVMTRNGH